MRDTEYTIWIKLELSNFDCGYYTYVGGNYSQIPFIFKQM